MTDFATLSLTVNGPLLAASLTALFRLGADSGFLGHASKASALANKLFDQLSGELEETIAPLVESGVSLRTSVVGPDGEPLSPSVPAVRINENFRNALDDYLTDGRQMLATYRKLRDLVNRLNAWSKQLRTYTPLILALSAIAVLSAVLDKAGVIPVHSALHGVVGSLSVGSAVIWFYYGTRIFLELNPLTDLEAQYDYL